MRARVCARWGRARRAAGRQLRSAGRLGLGPVLRGSRQRRRRSCSRSCARWPTPRPARADPPGYSTSCRRSQTRPASTSLLLLLLLLLSLQTPTRQQMTSCRRCLQPRGRAAQGVLFLRGLQRGTLDFHPFPPSPGFSPTRTFSRRVGGHLAPCNRPSPLPFCALCSRATPHFAREWLPRPLYYVLHPFPRVSVTCILALLCIPFSASRYLPLLSAFLSPLPLPLSLSSGASGAPL